MAIVMATKNGIPDFQALQNAFENARTDNILYYLFDLPYLDHHDLRRVRLDERRQLLESLLMSAEMPLFFSQSFDVSGAALLKNACDMQLEGLIGKLAGSSYQSVRSRHRSFERRYQTTTDRYIRRACTATSETSCWPSGVAGTHARWH